MGHVGQSSRLRNLVFGASEADWDALFADQLPRIHDFFRYRVGPGAIAEDLTSLTFEKAWVARGQYRRDLAAFGTWLYAIARNVAHDHFRRGRRHEPLEAAAGVAAGTTPEDLAVERSEHEHLARLLDALPDREREVIALKYGAGLTNRAIAKMTGLTESNVGTIVFRTVRELRARWEAPEAAPAPARAAFDEHEHEPRSRAVAGAPPAARWKEQR